MKALVGKSSAIGGFSIGWSEGLKIYRGYLRSKTLLHLNISDNAAALGQDSVYPW